MTCLVFSCLGFYFVDYVFDHFLSNERSGGAEVVGAYRTTLLFMIFVIVSYQIIGIILDFKVIIMGISLVKLELF